MPLLQYILPHEVCDNLHWQTLKVEPGSFVDKTLKERKTDLLYSIQTLSGGLTLVYVLLEHQSTVDAVMAFRMYEYVALILGRWRRHNPDAEIFPQIIPVVVYAGQTPWNKTTAVQDLIEGKTVDWTPKMHFILDDLSQVSDELLSKRALKAFGNITLRALLRLPKSPDPIKELDLWILLMRAMLRAPNGLVQLQCTIEYLAAVADLEPEALQPIVRQLGSAAEETAMTLAERLRTQGREEGKKEGRIEGRTEGRSQLMLGILEGKFGVPAPQAFVAKVQSGTEADFARWTARLFDAKTIEDVFDVD